MSGTVKVLGSNLTRTFFFKWEMFCFNKIIGQLSVCLSVFGLVVTVFLLRGIFFNDAFSV